MEQTTSGAEEHREDRSRATNRANSGSPGVGASLLGAKSVILKTVFYWAGRSMLEIFGRELTWAKEKIRAEEMARLRGRKLVRCEHCGNYKEAES